MEKIIDWSDFSRKAKNIAHSRFAFEKLKECLSLIEPTLFENYSPVSEVFARLGLFHIRLVRQICLEKRLRRLPPFFDDAPKEAVEAYNELMDALFMTHLASSFKVQIKEKPATLSFGERVDHLIKQAKNFVDIQNEATVLLKDPAEERDLSLLQGRLEDRQKRLDLILAQRRKLQSKLASCVLEVPTLFEELPSRPLGSDQQWQERLVAVRRVIEAAFIAPLPFATEQEFNKWALQNEIETTEASTAASAFFCMQLLEKKITEFREELKGVLPFLQQAYVEGFLLFLEEDVLSGIDAACEKKCLATLQLQHAALVRLDKEVRQESANTSKKAFTFIEKLYSPELLAYRDLPREIDKIISRDFSGELPAQRRLTPEVISEFHAVMKAFSEKQLQDIRSVVERGKRRNEKLEQIELFQKQVIKSTAHLTTFKELQAEKTALQEKVRHLLLPKKELQKASFVDIERMVDTHYLQYQSLLSRIPQIVASIDGKCELEELHCQDAKQTIKRRLFEIFFGISPYLDLAEIFSDLRANLTPKLIQGINTFYDGGFSSREYLLECQEMAYDHDVIKLRNEISYRSSRLKDLRDELVKLTNELTELRRLLEMAPGGVQEKSYGEVLLCLKEVLSLLYSIENPFQIFAKATSKDEINTVFRSLWMKIEGVQSKIEHAQETATTFVKTQTGIIKEKFLKAVDDLEEVLHQLVGTRPILVGQIERDFSYVQPHMMWDALVEQIHLLEKHYPFVRPLTFFMQIHDFQLRQKLFKEAKMVDDRLAMTRTFAKAMQYIKTFEEERVDVILEAFERQYLLEDEQSKDAAVQKAWERYRTRMYRSSRLVEEEILLDIGLLDMHALMDVEQARLQKILKFAIAQAKQHTLEPTWGLLSALSQAASLPQSPYGSSSTFVLCKKMYQELESQLRAWAETPPMEGAESAEYLEKLRTFCHYLFDAKVLIAGTKKQALAKSLLIMPELRTLCAHIEVWLQEKRGKIGSTPGASWGKPWIAECHEIRHVIEGFEMKENETTGLRMLVTKVFAMITQIPEVSQLKRAGPDFLEFGAMQKEMEQHLEEIDLLLQTRSLESPFFYIPGFLAFFGEGSWVKDHG